VELSFNYLDITNLEQYYYYYYYYYYRILNALPNTWNIKIYA
jgi:hypothetical protein